jgi:hypothetical protein
MNPLANDLIQRFKNTCNSIPMWAWQHEPSIPFIGEKYKPGNGLLIYASAENISGVYSNSKKKHLLKFFTGENAWNRYRVQYDEGEKEICDKKSFFPCVGIQPVNDGGLFAAGLFVAQKMGLPTPAKPRLFLETIAVSNWCKFSIHSEKNVDYIDGGIKQVGSIRYNGVELMKDSLPYVKEELALLQPKVVLIPKKVRTEFQTAMKTASPRSKILPVYQFNPTVVNFHLNKKEYDHSATELKCEPANKTLVDWMGQLKRINKDDAWRYIAMLNNITMQESTLGMVDSLEDDYWRS